MGKEEENMEGISISPAFSDPSDHITESEMIEQTLAYFDDLMNRDDLMKDKEVTCPWSYSTMSDDSMGDTWCFGNDSDISDMIAPVDRDLNKVISEVCHSYLFPEDLETEADGFEEADKPLQDTDPANTLEVPEPPKQVEVPEPTNNLDVPEPPQTLEVPEPPQTLEVPEPPQTLEVPEPPKTLEVPEPPQTPAPPQTLEVPEPPQTLEVPEPPKTLEVPEPPQTLEVPEPPQMLEVPEPPQTLEVPEPHQTLEVPESPKGLEVPEPTKNLEVPESPNTLEVPEPPKTLEVPEPPQTLEVPEPPQTLEVPEPHQTLEVPESPKGLEVPEPTKNLEVPESPNTLEVPESPTTQTMVMRLPSGKGKKERSQWRISFSRWRKRKTQPLEHLDAPFSYASADLTSRSSGEYKQGSLCSQETPSTTSCNAASRSIPLQLVDIEDKDQTPGAIRYDSSLSSASSITLVHQFTDSDDETLSQISVVQCQPDSERLSKNKDDVEENKAKRSSNCFSRFFRSIFSKIPHSDNMGKEEENMEGISIPPAFSDPSDHITESEMIEQTLAYFDDLMNRDDLMKDKEVTSPWSYSTMSDDSMGDTWCFGNDSDISDMIAPVDRDLDKVISEVCPSYLFPEDLETEADGFEEADKPLQDTDPANTLEVHEPPKQVEVPEPTKNLDVPEPPQTLEVPEPPQTLEVPESPQTLEVPESPQTLEVPEPHKTLEVPEPPQTLEVPESPKTLEVPEPPQTLEVPEPPQTLEVPESPQTLEVPEPHKTLEVPEPPQTLEVPESPKTLEVPESPQTLEVPEPPQTLEVPEPPQTLEVPEPHQTLEVPESPKGLEVPEPTKNLEVPESPNTLEFPESPTTQTMVMRLPSGKGKKERSQWRISFSRWRKRKTQPLEHLDAPFSYASADLTSRSSGEYKQGSLCSQETPSTTSCNAASRSIPLQLVDIEDKDQTPGAIRNDSSLSSASSITLVHQFTDSDDETLSQISVVQCQPDSERLSKNKDDVEENKAKRSSNCFSRFFRSIFSKNEKDNARQPAFLEETGVLHLP
ncbi:hypothetical protein KUCAC02_008398 [Chaenocephalus aceratus]|uniref:Uncharacterized protein n=1 Tax=Chaenocephalus aceratus TaxID=36190 RepID=A0ACB9X981_CHAAC|nr:hypothetical protein KUCAC02_008398 [Chaenocephalus aceratus]